MEEGMRDGTDKDEDEDEDDNKRCVYFAVRYPWNPKPKPDYEVFILFLFLFFISIWESIMYNTTLAEQSQLIVLSLENRPDIDDIRQRCQQFHPKLM